MRNRTAASRGPHLVQDCGSSERHRPAAQILSHLPGNSSPERDQTSGSIPAACNSPQATAPCRKSPHGAPKRRFAPAQNGCAPALLRRGLACFISDETGPRRIGAPPPPWGSKTSTDIQAPPGFPAGAGEALTKGIPITKTSRDAGSRLDNRMTQL